jgi:hypothetical protein
MLGGAGRTKCTGPVNLVGRRNPFDQKFPAELADTILEAAVGHLRKQPVRADIVPDERWPGMWRVTLADGSLSDIMNLPRARDLALAIANDIPPRRDAAAADFFAGPTGLPDPMPPLAVTGTTGPPQPMSP